MDVKKGVTLLDPKDYTIAPGSNFRRARVNDMRPLFLDQISGKKSNENISAVAYLKQQSNFPRTRDYQTSFASMIRTLLPEKLTTLMMTTT